MRNFIFLVRSLLAAGSLPADEPGRNWSKSLTVDFGELVVRLESRSCWTLYGVEFQVKKLGRRPGAAQSNAGNHRFRNDSRRNRHGDRSRGPQPAVAAAQ